MKTTDQVVRERIQELCRNRNYTINKVATLSGFSTSTLRDFMNGKNSNIGVITLKKICDGFGISLYDFFDTEPFQILEQEIK